MPKQLLTILGSIPILMSCLAGTASGQAGELPRRLARATTLNCAFPVKADGLWRDGIPAVEVERAQLKVKFTNVKTDEGTADSESTFGGSFIVVRYANGYLHFMQMLGSGPLYTTTVIAKETKDGRLMAVHTKHEYADVRLPGFTSSPEMYFGDCSLGD